MSKLLTALLTKRSVAKKDAQLEEATLELRDTRHGGGDRRPRKRDSSVMEQEEPEAPADGEDGQAAVIDLDEVIAKDKKSKSEAALAMAKKLSQANAALAVPPQPMKRSRAQQLQEESGVVLCKAPSTVCASCVAPC
jgi:hypothetical protein